MPPDPSSQLACTLGGNIAMNAGGAHCLKYGVTTNNVLGLRVVLMNGEIVEIGGDHLDAAGYDFLGLIIGSEGQLGIVPIRWLGLRSLGNRQPTVTLECERDPSARGHSFASLAEKRHDRRNLQPS